MQRRNSADTSVFRQNNNESIATGSKSNGTSACINRMKIIIDMKTTAKTKCLSMTILLYSRPADLKTPILPIYLLLLLQKKLFHSLSGKALMHRGISLTICSCLRGARIHRRYSCMRASCLSRTPYLSGRFQLHSPRPQPLRSAWCKAACGKEAQTPVPVQHI